MNEPPSSEKMPYQQRQHEDGEPPAELPSREEEDEEIAELVDLATFDVSDVFRAVEVRMSIAEQNARASVAALASGAETATTAKAAEAAHYPEPHEVFSSTTGKVFPETQKELDVAEQALADELNQMSLTERDRIMFEMHGIATEQPDETPEMVEAALVELEEKLDRILGEQKAAYEQAKYIDPDFVNDKAFRLMFLRSELFDCEKAAIKIVKHFTIKRELFGDGEILCRDIRLSDLDEDDMASLESAFFQILPTRDPAGRAIVVFSPQQKVFKVPENLSRTMWYMMSTCLKDEETQKKGVVFVLYALGHTTDDLEVMRRVHWAREGLAKRIVGIHQCISDDSLKPFFVSAKMYLLNKQLRSRLRPHHGDRDDIMFELQTFGIPVNEQLLQPNGSLSKAWHREWLEVRKTQEDALAAEESSNQGVLVPRRFDVLFGRGKNTREHTGNLRCVLLVETNQEKYEAATKYEKTEIAERIVTMIYESYGRFLKWENKEGWIEVDRDAAREKISHFFRHLRSKKPPGPGMAAKSGGGHITSKRVTPCPSPLFSSVNGTDSIRERSTKQIRGNDGAAQA